MSPGQADAGWQGTLSGKRYSDLSAARGRSLQMALIQRDYVVEQVAAAASDPTLGDPILPGTPNRGTDRCHVQRVHRRWHFQAVLRVMVE